MTASPAPDLGALDELDRVYAQAAPGEWEHLAGQGIWVADEALGFGTFVSTDIDDDIAALIVAAVNAVPRLAAAVRAAIEVAEEMDRDAEERGLRLDRCIPPGDGIRTALAAVLSGEAHREQQ